MRRIQQLQFPLVVFVVCIAAAVAVQAQTLTTLASFDRTDGAFPSGTLVQGVNGNYYGTTGGGGAHCISNGNCGTVFEINPAGTLTTLYSFCSQPRCADGASPYAGLVLASNGNFYGTTETGGAHHACYDGGCGTIFEITPTGKLTTLYNFCSQPGCTDGGNPYGILVQASNGNFYGTTELGGTNNGGTVFEITPAGTLTTLYRFCSQANCADGSLPRAGLVQASDGNFYGTTYQGGTKGGGTVFEITPAGTLTTLYTFCSQPDCADGRLPLAGLVQASDGNFYGTTYGGHAGGGNTGDTVFEITPAGTLTTLYTFCSQANCADGKLPYSGLVQATDGNFYGTTYGGGAHSDGTVFEITPAGTLTTLYSFCSQANCADGSLLYAGLLQATNGNLYGTAYLGGSNGDGTVFSLSVGLSPFVETLPTVGKVGTHVGILGNNLTGTTSVTFNGTAATFTVVSDTEITTVVPTGATTGKVQVTTPSGTLTSNVVFRVR